MAFAAGCLYCPAQTAFGHFRCRLELRSIRRQVRRYQKARRVAFEVLLPTLYYLFRTCRVGEFNVDVPSRRLWLRDELDNRVGELGDSARQINAWMQSLA